MGPRGFEEAIQKAYARLAQMLNCVEAGSNWPSQMNESRAAFMAKDEEDELNPLAYRVLLMAPSIYRMCARAFAAHLQPWIAQWTTPEIFAGMEGQGAEEAAYHASLFLERCQVHGVDFTGGGQQVYSSS